MSNHSKNELERSIETMAILSDELHEKVVLLARMALT